MPHDHYILALIPNIEQRYKNESLRIERRKPLSLNLILSHLTLGILDTSRVRTHDTTLCGLYMELL